VTGGTAGGHWTRPVVLGLPQAGHFGDLRRLPAVLSPKESSSRLKLLLSDKAHEHRAFLIA